jgi:tetratricopeptide (TPR) repeat protein
VLQPIARCARTRGRSSLQTAAGLNWVDQGELGRAYSEAKALVERRPQSAQAHFAMAYVLRYASLLEESAHECDLLLRLDPGNYFWRSCAQVFMQMGKTERAKDFLALDADSEWAAFTGPNILLREGKMNEARESVKLKSASPGLRRDVLEVCLGLRSPSDFDKNVREVEREAMAITDPEPKYFSGAILSFCGQNESALRLLKRAIEQNYCSYSALQSEPSTGKAARDISGTRNETSDCSPAPKIRAESADQAAIIPVSNQSADFPNARLLAKSTAAPGSFPRHSSEERCP